MRTHLHCVSFTCKVQDKTTPGASQYFPMTRKQLRTVSSSRGNVHPLFSLAKCLPQTIRLFTDSDCEVQSHCKNLQLVSCEVLVTT